MHEDGEVSSRAGGSGVGWLLATKGRRALALAVGATVMAIWETLQSGFLLEYAYDRPIEIGLVVRSVAPFWYIFAVLVPAIIAVAKRVPLEDTPWIRFAATHIVAGATFVLIHLSAAVFFSQVVLTGLSDLGPEASFAHSLANVLSTYVFSQFFSYIAVVGGYYAWDYSQKFLERERQAAELRILASDLRADAFQATLRALRMQLHPHFLFNALNSVAGLVRKNERERAVEVLSELGDLLRITLSGESPNEVPLEEEIQFLIHYLRIEEVRFPDRLAVEFDIEPETLSCYVPAMILQPLVENAIRHGIAKTEKQGKVTVRVRELEGDLEIAVLDTGPGPPPRGEVEYGIGLSNTAQRLGRLYGSHGELRLQRRSPNGGTQVSIRLPVLRAELPDAGAAVP